MGRDDAFDIDDVRVVRTELMVPSFPKIYGISADLLPFSQAFDLFIWQCPSEKRYAVPFRGSKINHNFFPLPISFCFTRESDITNLARRSDYAIKSL